MKVGFTCGSFDLLHAGHLLMLEEARSVCDKLIVGLQMDPSVDRKHKNKPIQTLEEREIQLKAVKFVDEIIIYQTEKDLFNWLVYLNPDIRILGEDHKNKKFTGHELEIELYFNSRSHNWSSSELRERVYKSESRRFDKA